MKTLSLVPLTLALALSAALAQAQTPVPSYRCGGIGSDESAAMKAEAASHDIMLTFAVSTGAYLSDVMVDIRNAGGQTVVSTKCNGPIMLVDLPAAGAYTVNAQYGGVAKQQTVSVARPRKGTSATLVWPAPPVK